MLLTRREALAGLGGGAAVLMAPPAFAQGAYPSQNIKLIVPYPPGGTTDFLGRLIAEQLKTGLPATVFVENKPGAGTVLGALIIQTLTYTTYSIGVPPEATLVVKAIVVLFVSVIQSSVARAMLVRQLLRAFAFVKTKPLTGTPQ